MLLFHAAVPCTLNGGYFARIVVGPVSDTLQAGQAGSEGHANGKPTLKQLTSGPAPVALHFSAVRAPTTIEVTRRATRTFRPPTRFFSNS